MKYIGGKINILCELHKKHLINSTEGEATCNCGRIKFYHCCSFVCKLYVRKSWTDRLDPDFINIIDNSWNSTGVDPEDNEYSNDNDDLILPYNSENSSGGGDYN